MNYIKTQARLFFALFIIFSTSQYSAHADENNNRLVSIGGSVTEIIFALGEESRLIARDTTSMYPKKALDLPDVGYIRNLSPEGVLSVKPNQIITLEGAGPPEAISVLKSSGISINLIKETYDEEGVVYKILEVGKALSVDNKAQTLAAEVKKDFRAAEELIQNILIPKKVLFVLSYKGGKIMAAGTDTSAHGMITMAGATNALIGIKGYKPITDEAVIKAAPDIILVMDRHGASDPKTDLLNLPTISKTPAGKSKSIIKMDGLYLLGYGPRTGKAVLELTGLIYGNSSKNN